jgi:hypothetical protein
MEADFVTGSRNDNAGCSALFVNSYLHVEFAPFKNVLSYKKKFAQALLSSGDKELMVFCPI